jgi:hypothetical protein
MRTTEPLIQAVGDGWYIGGWPASAKALPQEECSVIDCTSEYPRTHDRPYICLPTWDTQGVLPIQLALQRSLSQSAGLLARSMPAHHSVLIWMADSYSISGCSGVLVVCYSGPQQFCAIALP